MERLTRCKLALAVGLSALALVAQAQQPAATTPSANAPAAQSSHSGAQPAHAKTKHATHARGSTAHHAMRHGNQAMAGNETTSADSAYKSALRQCVTGPQSARDSCLDEAIARYGHA